MEIGEGFLVKFFSVFFYEEGIAFGDVSIFCFEAIEAFFAGFDFGAFPAPVEIFVAGTDKVCAVSVSADCGIGTDAE